MILTHGKTIAIVIGEPNIGHVMTCDELFVTRTALPGGGWGGWGGVLSSTGYIGRCRGIGYGFWRFSILK